MKEAGVCGRWTFEHKFGCVGRPLGTFALLWSCYRDQTGQHSHLYGRPKRPLNRPNAKAMRKKISETSPPPPFRTLHT